MAVICNKAERCKFASLIFKAKDSYWEKVFSFGLFNVLIVLWLGLLFIVGGVFINWIVQNWRKANEVVKEKEIIRDKQKM